ncbi:MAG: hypothetical protein WA432_04190 [Candidatus Babeliaceae bacterium]
MQQNFLSDSYAELDLSDQVFEQSISSQTKELFITHIYAYYRLHGRQFIWRQTTDPYHIVVSEVMLQQTQTDRVKEKFVTFIAQLPTFQALAIADARDVLALWSGLGYNRRALALQKLAQQVVNNYQGILPADPEILDTFPGIGKATAASICAFAFNMPTIFIETNIRAIYIHTFFRNQAEVHDHELITLVEQTIDKSNARQWYYALMDYGVMLKKLYKNPSRKSAHYTKQSKFEGSERQIRGMILKILTQQQTATFEMLCYLIEREPVRIKHNLQDLCAEGFIKQKDNCFFI